MALIDYPKDEDSMQLGIRWMKVHKVKLHKSAHKLAQPRLWQEDKECLATYVKVGGHEA